MGQQQINLGILIYENSFSPAASGNIGDYVQSLAAINIYKKIIEGFHKTNYEIEEFIEGILRNDIPAFNFIFIKRDNMHETDQYKGAKNIITIMNGWWMHPYDASKNISFKMPENINPIFTSFHIANDELLDSQYINELKPFEPIGTRDLKTTEKLLARGVKAFFSGCLTTTIDFYKWKDTTSKTYYVNVSIKDNQEAVREDQVGAEWKIIKFKEGLRTALKFLKKYSNCKNVVTSKLHCYLPCLAMGTPVDFLTPTGVDTQTPWGSKHRFEGLRDLNLKPDKLQSMKKTLTKDTMLRVKEQIKKVTK